MNAEIDSRGIYVYYTCPVTGIAVRSAILSRLGKAVIAGNIEEVKRLTIQAQRDLDRQIRVAELRGRTGRALAWITLHSHAIKQGKTFTIHLLPMVQL